jgi:prolipoprotein diacylglyceryltransferase
VPPITYQFGPIEIRAFTFWIAIGVLISVSLLCMLAWRRGERMLPCLDVAVAVLLFGILGARIGHVLLSWEYFSAHSDEIWSLAGGGLNWHGALLGGLLGALMAGLWRGVPLLALGDRLALVIPIMAGAIWMASVVSNNTYAVEVRSLADFPAWMVVESPDIYGISAPRLALANVGVTSALVLFLLLAALDVLRWLPGVRLWLGIALYSLAMYFIGFFRADPVGLVLTRRAEQLLDLGVTAASVIALVSISILRRKRAVLSATGAM